MPGLKQMTESLSTVSLKSGLPPGSLVHVGNVPETETGMHVIDYDRDRVEERTLQHIDDILQYRESDSITWVTIEGLTNVDVVERIGTLFGVHQLVLEDILNTHQRPKFEEYEDHLFIVLKCLLPGAGGFGVRFEQVSLLVFSHVVFLFKENRDDIFLPLQQRVMASKGRLRGLGSDYLAYSILDSVVDQNFVLIDLLDETVTSLEDRLLVSDPSKDMLHQIQRLKREIISIRRYVSPIRELLTGMLHSDSELINEKTHIYLRDVYDHTVRIIESIESYRDILTGLLDIYISSLSNKMNEVMKVLTVFASIFIPLTFLAGIYGMNFEYMPELKWKWAYPALWGAFVTIPVVLLVYFKRKKWL